MTLYCTQSGALVNPDDTDGNGVLRRLCDCGRTVVTDDGPAGHRVVRRHPMFPTSMPGRLGLAEALLRDVAGHMAPSPGGGVRVLLAAHTAERIRQVVEGFTREMYERAGDHESLPVDAGAPW